MQDLRLVGVHEDGGHLLLSGKGGETFRLRIDEALRVAANRPTHRTAQPADPASGPTMTPRDIQARIRAGASAEEVAALSGHDLAHVLRYEGPVRAERDYIARQAQGVEVAAPGASPAERHRTAFGERPVSLGEMVAFRLRDFGVDPEDVEWDAWRRPDNSWEVVARFALPADSGVSVGEEPPARWMFSPIRRSVTNANRWAQLLSELVPLDSPLPARRLAAVADRVFDFEAEAGAEEATPDDTDNLLSVLRSRRGQRLGADEDADDALAAMLAKGSIPAAHPRPGHDGEEEDGAAPRTGRLNLVAAADEDAPSPDDPLLLPGAPVQTREITLLARPFRRRDAGAQVPDVRREDDEGDDEPSGAGTGGQEPAEAFPEAEQEPVEPETPSRPARGGGFPWDKVEPAPGHEEAEEARGSRRGEENPRERRSIKPKRSSVPSWDEIVFGTKGD